MSWKPQGITDAFAKREFNADVVRYTINLWTKKDEGTTKKVLTAEVPGKDVLMLRLTKF